MSREDLKVEPPFCPFKYRVLGPFPGGPSIDPKSMRMEFRSLEGPCTKEDCALWDDAFKTCSFLKLHELTIIANSLVCIKEEVESVSGSLLDSVEVKKELLKTLKAESKNVSKDSGGP